MDIPSPASSAEEAVLTPAEAAGAGVRSLEPGEEAGEEAAQDGVARERAGSSGVGGAVGETARLLVGLELAAEGL